MRLFVYCNYCRNKIYFNSSVQTRNELPFNFVLKCPQFTCSVHGEDIAYFRNDVKAETDQRGVISGALILGVLGAVAGGPAGAVLGGLIGGAAGSNTDKSDSIAVERFNNS